MDTEIYICSSPFLLLSMSGTVGESLSVCLSQKIHWLSRAILSDISMSNVRWSTSADKVDTGPRRPTVSSDSNQPIGLLYIDKSLSDCPGGRTRSCWSLRHMATLQTPTCYQRALICRIRRLHGTWISLPCT